MKLMKIIFCFIIISFISLSFQRTKERRFVSSKVEEKIESLRNKFKDENLFKIYENCFPNTLDTTVFTEENDTFIITGDIEAMWLRDSSFQVLPYFSFLNDDMKLKNMIENLIKRQSELITLDPYANAFNKNHTGTFNNDETYKKINGEKVNAMNDLIFERKWEIDSIISSLYMHYLFNLKTNSTDFINDKYLEMLRIIIKTIEEQSLGQDTEEENWTYFFQRNYKEPFDTLHQGRGNPGRTCGLIRSSFRASDDATLLPYNIPENAFLVSTFRKISSVLMNYYQKKCVKSFELWTSHCNEILDINKILIRISDQVFEAIIEHGIIEEKQNNLRKKSKSKTQENEFYFAYEVDCFGNHYFMDDANYPSLLSLVFLEFIDDELNFSKRLMKKEFESIKDVNSSPSSIYAFNEYHDLISNFNEFDFKKVYLNTRRKIFDLKTNPYYFESSKTNNKNIDKFTFKGVSSPHYNRGFIWPLGLIMRALTTTDISEIKETLEMLQLSAFDGYIHETFNVNNPKEFTRSWFAWANSFFGLLINTIIDENPDLILK